LTDAVRDNNYTWTPVSSDGAVYKDNFPDPFKLSPSKHILISADIFADAVADYHRLLILGVVALCPEHKFVIQTNFPDIARRFMNDFYYSSFHNRSESGEGWCTSGIVGDMMTDRADRWLSGYVPARLILGRCGYYKKIAFKWPLKNLEIRNA